MPLTLTAADNAAAPTGAVATIVGTGGAAVTLNVQSADAAAGTGSWSAAGTRIGDGAVSLTLGTGRYWLYAATTTDLSPVVYLAVTDGLAPVKVRCAGAVVARLRQLALPCTRNVYDSQFDFTSVYLDKPCTLVTTNDAEDTDEAALNGRDDLGRVFRLQIVDVIAGRDEARKDVYRGWRQAVFRAFHNQRLPGVAESVRNRVRVGAVRTAQGNQKLFMVSEMTLTCITREVRGLGA